MNHFYKVPSYFLCQHCHQVIPGEVKKGTNVVIVRHPKGWPNCINENKIFMWRMEEVELEQI